MISFDRVTYRPMRFNRDNQLVICPRLVLTSDGKIAGHRHRNEARWEFIDDTLCFLTADGAVSTRFDKVIELGAGAFRLEGQFLLGDDPVTHSLELNTGEAAKLPSELHVRLNLTSEKPTLLVVFNSAGFPFDGLDSHWEFFNLVKRAQVDTVRFSETLPAFWYLDKTSKIIGMLRGIIPNGYRKVLFCGMSSGGYASIYFAEALAEFFPNQQFRSFSINPQTAHAAKHRQHMVREMGSDHPLLISEQALAMKDCTETELANIIKKRNSNKKNALHNIFYDSGNKSEIYYANLLARNSRVRLHPHNLGLNHRFGCEDLFTKDIIQQKIIEEAESVSAENASNTSSKKPRISLKPLRWLKSIQSS